MVRTAVNHLVTSAIERLVGRGALPDGTRGVAVLIDTPKAEAHGDFMTNYALIAAKVVGMQPRQLAETLAEEARATEPEAFESVEVAGPGFLNFRLRPDWTARHLVQICAEGPAFGKSQPQHPLRINVEFVSVNPNGPITIGSGRGAAFGSALCNVLEAAGHTVHREYYINDGVNSEQMRLFAESVLAIIEGRPVPENGYKGDYVAEVAHMIGQPGTVSDLDQKVEEVWQHYHANRTVREDSGLGSQHTSQASPQDVSLAFWQAKRHLRSEMAATGDGAGALSLERVRAAAETAMVVKQWADLRAFNTEFDTWFSEQSLHESGQVGRDLDHLVTSRVADDDAYQTEVRRAKGGAVTEVEKSQQAEPDEADGANGTIWLRSTKFGDEKDRVLRRSDGRLTYIASDVAYHKDKFNRPAGADRLITVLGPDHHGYIGRLQAVVGALHADMADPIGDGRPLDDHEQALFSSVEERNRCLASLAWAKEHLEVLIFQVVRFVKDGQPAPMRKRDGNIYALIDLITEIGEQVQPNGTPEEKSRAGADVARFFYLMRHHDTAMDFDLELATKQSDENPVFYVQYAHARICSVIDKAKEAGLTAPSAIEPRLAALLTHPKESALVLKIAEFPSEVRRAAEDYGVNRLASYSLELARTYHAFYDSCRVVQPEAADLSQARLALCGATKTTLASALGLLGVSAPERM